MSPKSFENSETDSSDSQLVFVLLLKKYPVLLEKSNIPSVRQQKKITYPTLITELKDKLNNILSERALIKKINNMKYQVKTKSDLNETGNKPIVLLEWEKIFLELVKSKTNPTFSKVPGKYSTLRDDNLNV